MKPRPQTNNYPLAAPDTKVRGKGTFRGIFALLATLVTILSVIGLSSCAGYTSAANGQTQTPSTGVLTPSATTLTFGSVSVGGTATQSISVTNTGTATVNIGQATISGAGFTFVGGNPSTSIPVGQSSTVQVQFAPASAGAVTGSITVTSDASNSPLTVSLTGTGTQPVLSMTPASVSFGNVTVGQTGSQTVKLTNNGNVNLTINPATVAGTGFAMSGLSIPATIGAGQSVSFTAQFTPASVGGATGSISFTDNGPNSPQTLTMAGTGMAANATLSPNPGSFAFGNVVVGANSGQLITLTNTGSASITISQATASGPGFSITGSPAGKVIAAGGNTTFTAQFAPTTAGNLSGGVTITSNATNPTLTIALTGTGTQGALSANPTSINFGSLLVNASSTVAVTLSNSGTASTTISTATASGTGYSISGLSAGQVIAAGGNATFTAKFAPTTTGSPIGSITITSNAPTSPLTIGLTGTAVATQAQLAINPPSENFGNVAVGANNPQTITLNNTGNATLTISTASATGPGFSMNGLTAGQTIAAGGNATFTATFTPTVSGAAAGSISITSNAPGSPATIVLSGTGTQSVASANPSSAGFGNVVIGNNNSQSIMLKNTGNATLTFSQVTVNGAGFSITGLSTSTTIAAGGNMSFNAIFTPGSATTVNGSVVLTTNGSPAQLTIPLSGMGVTATLVLGSNPTSLSFGEVNINTNISLTSVVTNTGNSNVTISNVSVSGTGLTASGISNGLVLQPNQTATLTVKFAPTATGALTSANVTITSNASPMVIAITGTAVQHSVGLNWTGSSTTDVTGYYVYRSATSPTSGFAKLNPSTPVQAPTTQYNDASVQAATTYYYVVTAVDSSGVESSDTSPATASIP